MLERLRGFVFDLDGCVWNGDVLNPGAREALAGLHQGGRRLAFISNNSRATGANLRDKLQRLGVDVAEHVLTPLDIIGRAIRERWGPSRVLVMGAPEMTDVIAQAGHEIVQTKDYRRATVVAVGNDFDLSFERLTAAARAVGAGAGLVTPNVDPRLPVEGGDFLPGCGAIVQAVAAAGLASPVVVGKPESPLFRIALECLGLQPSETAMVGDSLPSDVAGGRAAGMLTVLYAPHGAPKGNGADVTVRSFDELARRSGVTCGK